MYTPSRRASVSDTPYRFTPSKRGQAALDALALGYDVQLPEYSFALLPRSSASEQALASFLPPRATQDDQMSQSTSFVDVHRRTGSGPRQGSEHQRRHDSERSERKRFARQACPPRGENVGDITTLGDGRNDVSTHCSSISTLFDSAISSNSSRQPIASQYELTIPCRTQQPTDLALQTLEGATSIVSHTPRDISNTHSPTDYSRHHSSCQHHASPGKLARRPHQAKADGLTFLASPPSKTEAAHKPHGSRATPARGCSARASPHKQTTPLFTPSTLEHSLDAYFSPRGINEQANILGTGSMAPYTRGFFGAPALHSAFKHDTRSSLYDARPPMLTSPIREPDFIPGHNYSPVYQMARLLEEEGTDSGISARSQPQRQHRYSESEPATGSRRSDRYNGSLGPPLTPSSVLSSLPSSYGESPASSHSQSSSGKPLLRVSTQTHHGSTTQPLRSAPLPSPHAAHTPSSSRTTPSFRDELDDEAFKVHPERAAMSRMESLLLLSACRNEVEGRKPVMAGVQGYDRTGRGGITGYPAVDGVVVAASPDSLGLTGLQAGGQNIRNLAYPTLSLGEPMMSSPAELPKELSFQPPYMPQARSPAGRRSRQRSGSVGPPNSDFSHRPRPFQGPSRHRQRSTSVVVQGLSAEAVKKLRAYETVKYREEGERSLRAMVGCDGQDQYPKAREPKATPRNNPRSLKIPFSPAQVPLPLSPAGTTLPFRGEFSSSVSLVTEAPALSPCNVPLPPSPPHSPTACLPHEASPTISPLVSSDSFMKYRASQGIQSPRPIRTRQNTSTGRVVPTFRLVSSPEVLGRQSTLENFETGVEKTQKTDAGVTESVEGPTLGSGLRIEPRIERILTPPPSFWSPPPLSAVVRTSAPLLPAANVQNSVPVTRAASISLPPTRTASAPPLRPASVPPSTDSLSVTILDETRRAWSCEPASEGARPVKSFAGDWTQCMIIDISDDEDGSESEDVDQSESEDEGEEVEGDRIEEESQDEVLTPEPQEDSTPRVEPWAVEASEVRVAQNEDGGTRYQSNRGVPLNSTSGGANAVEAVQHAIVKLALDNAEAVNVPRLPPVLSKPTVARYGAPPSSRPSNGQMNPRQTLDAQSIYEFNQLRALTNSYFSGTSRAYHAPNLHAYSMSNNLALETLRSGLEMRAAASVTAVEEAVRARSESPSLPHPDSHVMAARSASGFVLPPRLQRLQGAQQWTPPRPSLARLDTGILAQQRRSSTHNSPVGISPQTTGAYNPLNILHHNALPAPQFVNSLSYAGFNPNPLSLESNRSISSSRHNATTLTSPGASKSHPARLSKIVVDNRPVPPPPATAPMRSAPGHHDRQQRRSADAVLPQPQVEARATLASSSSAVSSPDPAAPSQVATASTSAQSVTSSPKPKNKSRAYRRNHKPKKSASPKTDKENPPPAIAPAASPKPVAPPPQPKDTPVTAAPKSKRSRKPYKKSKPTKPGASQVTG